MPSQTSRLLTAIWPPEWIPQEWLQLWARFWEYGAAGISVIVLAVLIYLGYRTLKVAGSLELIRGVFSVGLLYLVAYILHLEFLTWLLDRIIPALLILVAVILQPELRRIFVEIGSRSLLHLHRNSSANDSRAIQDVVEACKTLSDMGRGALIVFQRTNSLRTIVRTGVALHSAVSSELLVSIFGYDTPLHDGATILAKTQVVASGCVLPIDLEDRSLLFLSSGTRHRAALELVRKTDAVALIVSEETGRISLACNGQLQKPMNADKTCCQLQKLLTAESPQKTRRSLWSLWSLRKKRKPGTQEEEEHTDKKSTPQSAAPGSAAKRP